MQGEGGKARRRQSRAGMGVEMREGQAQEGEGFSSGSRTNSDPLLEPEPPC